MEYSRIRFIYDTDPQNDRFIKGSLKRRELYILDRILEQEKKNCGLRLSSAELNALSKYDPEINDAYSRWRVCKDMMRSHHRCVYPSERKMYFRK